MKRVIARHEAGAVPERAARGHNYELRPQGGPDRRIGGRTSTLLVMPRLRGFGHRRPDLSQGGESSSGALLALPNLAHGALLRILPGWLPGTARGRGQQASPMQTVQGFRRSVHVRTGESSRWVKTPPCCVAWRRPLCSARKVLASVAATLSSRCAESLTS